MAVAPTSRVESTFSSALMRPGTSSRGTLHTSRGGDGSLATSNKLTDEFESLASRIHLFQQWLRAVRTGRVHHPVVQWPGSAFQHLF